MTAGRLILAAAAVLAAAVVAYAAWSAHQKKAQQQAISELVEVGAQAATAALQGEATAAQAAAVRQAAEKLPSGSGRQQRAMSLAADQYLATCRAIVERRVDLQRLSRQAADSRNALNAHMRAAGSRNNSWIQRATELKRRADQDHAALERALTALVDLLESLRDPEKTLVTYMDGAKLVPASLRESSLERTRAEAKRAAERASAYTREETEAIQRFQQK